MKLGLITFALALVACGGNGGDGSIGATSDGGATSIDGGGGGGAGGGGAPSGGGTSNDGGSISDDGGAVSAGDAGCDSKSSAPPPADAPACTGTTLFARPSDPSARGPWAVGAHTATIAGLTTEIWYPAKWGSDACKSPARYDVREHLPPSEQKKIPDSDAPIQICDCYRDLPIDDAHGPYPVISFIHGTAAFRTQSLTFATHWASRGFVVVASDHPHIQLADILTLNVVGTDQQGDAIKVLAALDAPAGDLAFLAGHIDMTRIGAAGHSAGGQAVAGIAAKRSGIRVVVPMAAGGVTAGGDLASSLVMSAADDGIAQPSGQTSGYSSTPAPKRFVQIANAGHLVFSDLCSIGASEGGLLAIAVKYGVSGASTLASLANDGCSWQTGKSYTPITPEEGWHVVDFATSAAFEATLLCDASMPAQLAGIAQSVPNVASYQEQLQ